MKKLICLFLLISSFSYSLSAQKLTKEDLITKAREAVYEDPDQSLAQTEQLLKKENTPDDMASLYLLKSIAYIAKRDYEESLKYVNKAQLLLKEIKDPAIKAKVLTSIAVQYQQMELFSKCFEILNEAEEITTVLPETSVVKYSVLGKIFALRGMVYKSQSNYDVSLEKFLTAAKYLQKIAPKEMSNNSLSVVYYNIGYCYFDLNNKAKSEEYFHKSSEYAEKANAKSLKDFALKGLADVYLISGKHQQAIQLLHQAEVSSKGIGDLMLNEGIYKGLADNYLAINNFEQYQVYNKLYYDTRFKKEQNELKSINREINNRVINNQKNKEALSSKFFYLNIIIISVGIFAMTIILYFLRKTWKSNQAYKKKINQLITS